MPFCGFISIHCFRAQRSVKAGRTTPQTATSSAPPTSNRKQSGYHAAMVRNDIPHCLGMTTCITANAVTDLVVEPIMNGVCAVTGVPLG